MMKKPTFTIIDTNAPKEVANTLKRIIIDSIKKNSQ